MTQSLLGNSFTLEVLIFFAMALVGGVVVLEPDAALGWSLALGAIVGALAGEVFGLSRLLLAMLVAVCAAVGTILYHQIEGQFADWVRNRVKVGRWDREGGIALQAGLGAAFGALMAVEEFRHALADSLTASGLLFILIGTALSTLLIIPLHRVIMGEAQEEQQRPRIASSEPVSRFGAARRYLKPAVIFFALYAVEYVNKAVEETIKNSTLSLAVIMFSVLTASVVTWFWSASLHEGHAGNWPALFRTVTVGTIFGLPFAFGVTLPLWRPIAAELLRPLVPNLIGPPGMLPPDQEHQFGEFLVGAVVIGTAVILSLMAAALLLGVFSFFGEYLIRGLRRAKAGVFYLGLLIVLLIAAVLLELGLAVAVRRAPETLVGPLRNLSDLFYPALAAGWVLGLWLGNFYDVVRPPRLPPAAGQASEAKPTANESANVT